MRGVEVVEQYLGIGAMTARVVVATGVAPEDLDILVLEGLGEVEHGEAMRIGMAEKLGVGGPGVGAMLTKRSVELGREHHRGGDALVREMGGSGRKLSCQQCFPVGQAAPGNQGEAGVLVEMCVGEEPPVQRVGYESGRGRMCCGTLEYKDGITEYDRPVGAAVEQLPIHGHGLEGLDGVTEHGVLGDKDRARLGQIDHAETLFGEVRIEQVLQLNANGLFGGESGAKGDGVTHEENDTVMRGLRA